MPVIPGGKAATAIAGPVRRRDLDRGAASRLTRYVLLIRVTEPAFGRSILPILLSCPLSLLIQVGPLNFRFQTNTP